MIVGCTHNNYVLNKPSHIAVVSDSALNHRSFAFNGDGNPSSARSLDKWDWKRSTVYRCHICHICRTALMSWLFVLYSRVEFKCGQSRAESRAFLLCYEKSYKIIASESIASIELYQRIYFVTRSVVIWESYGCFEVGPCTPCTWFLRRIAIAMDNLRTLLYGS